MVLTEHYIGRVACVGSSQELIAVPKEAKGGADSSVSFSLLRLFHCGEERRAFLLVNNTRQDEDCVDDFIVRVAFCHVEPL